MTKKGNLMGVLWEEKEKETVLEKMQPCSAGQWYKTAGNQAVIQRMNEGEITPDGQPEEMQAENQRNPGFFRKIINGVGSVINGIGAVVTRLPKVVKMIMKSSIWGALVGLSYWLVGYLGTNEDKLSDILTKGQLAGIFALLFNAVALFSTLFGAMGWLNTDTAPTEMEEEPSRDLPGGLLGTGTAIAAITSDGYAISKGTNKAIGIAGLLSEIGAAMKSFGSICSTLNADDITACEKCKKTLKYLADLAASLTGAVAFAVSISSSSEALPLFMAEVIIRGVRFFFSVINTLYMLCCRHTGQADEETPPLERQDTP